MRRRLTCVSAEDGRFGEGAASPPNLSAETDLLNAAEACGPYKVARVCVAHARHIPETFMNGRPETET